MPPARLPARLRATLAALFAGLALALSGLMPARAADDPVALLQSLADRVTAVMADSGMPAAQRKEKLRGLLREGFSVPTMGRIALGSYWQTAAEAERQDYLGVFEEMILKVYEPRLTEIAKRQFKIGRTIDERKTVLVETDVGQADGTSLRIHWRLYAPDGKLQIIDVIVDGLSLAKAQQADFAAVIQKTGSVAGLTQELRSKFSIAN